MSFDSAVLNFKNQFTVLDVVELNQSESDLYQQLLALKKSSYEPDEKILVIQSCEDTYLYVDDAGKQLATLQKFCAQLDISNFFITVLTGNLDIAAELAQVRAQYSNDHLPMQYHLVSVPYHKTIKQYEDTYCVLPWAHLYVGTTGDVLPCCVADQNRPLGNLKQSTVHEISKSTGATQLKRTMLAGQRSKSCAHCYEREDQDLDSPRIRHNKTMLAHKSTNIDHYDPVYLDIRINNICNFKCRMCSEWFSNSIAQETKILYGSQSKLAYHHIDISNLSSQERSDSFEKLLPYFDQDIEKIYFAGGEPLITKEHYMFLNHLISINNVDLEIFYNTNLSQLSYKNTSVIELWKHFGNVTVGASIDASGSVAEYLRHGTVWSTILQHIQLIKSQCPHVKLKIMSTVGFLNIENLVALQQHWINSGEFAAEDLVINVLTDPVFLSPAAAPDMHKHRLKRIIQDHVCWLNQNGAVALANSWASVLNYMLSNDLSFSLEEFKHRMSILDNHRGESFNEIFPEFCNIL